VTVRPRGDGLVVVTRPEESAAALSRALEAAGLRTLTVPSLRFVAACEPQDWRLTVERLATYSHIVFASRTAASFFAELCAERGPPLARVVERATVAAIGPATAERLRALGIAPAFVGGGRGAHELVRELVERGVVLPSSRVLVPRSDVALEALVDLLEQAGAGVDPLTVYSTVPEAPERAHELHAALGRGEHVAAITFASPSAVRGFLAVAGDVGAALLRDPGVRIVTIGGTTSGAVRDEGLEVDVEATLAGIDGLVDAALRALRSPRPG